MAIVSSSMPGSDSGSENPEISFYGYNSAVLAKNGASRDLSCATVDVTGTANGVFAFNKATINMTDVVINTSGKYGHGVDFTITSSEIYATARP